tara:strand:+ start:187 stop:297 length:111 start_codon:yes stop_codon:yes gene_type:complete
MVLFNSKYEREDGIDMEEVAILDPGRVGGSSGTFQM